MKRTRSAGTGEFIVELGVLTVPGETFIAAKMIGKRGH